MKERQYQLQFFYLSGKNWQSSLHWLRLLGTAHVLSEFLLISPLVAGSVQQHTECQTRS